jgi:hypothetical protein
VHNHDLNVNFATLSSQNTTMPGFTLGLGGEYQPASWRIFGKPVSVFLQYQRTWWSTANFNSMPCTVREQNLQTTCKPRIPFS